MKLTYHLHLVLRLRRVAQTVGARLPWGLNFVCWCLIFVDPQYGICFFASCLASSILRWLPDVRKICVPLHTGVHHFLCMLLCGA